MSGSQEFRHFIVVSKISFIMLIINLGRERQFHGFLVCVVGKVYIGIRRIALKHVLSRFPTASFHIYFRVNDIVIENCFELSNDNMNNCFYDPIQHALAIVL
ncbi:CLUMA_CG002322, isoform A [Clunio marinus]|uniref:CLUMA_CG002322, isoform A n=1 Tax=Clunio marinus TaxID=568069 RepID=A0A1J1HKH1_9DIPT|nr:CLUMA_CG002322, isoform A [Clunio marinus]